MDAMAERVWTVLRGGGLALVPTRAGFGLVAACSEAVRRIYELKGRPASKPCVTVADAAVFADVSEPLPKDVEEWVGGVLRRSPLALVTRRSARSRLLGQLDPYTLGQCTQDDTVATFHGVGPLVQRVAALAYAEGRIVVGSSANLSGTGNNYALADVPPSMLAGADLVVADPTLGRSAAPDAPRLATTLLDLTRGEFLRRGIDFPEIERSWVAFRAGEPSQVTPARADQRGASQRSARRTHSVAPSGRSASLKS
jgi:tRNA A37 threonylcarbamoyladenosine synthetase subunit TsaC/SUA5/YrdC